MGTSALYNPNYSKPYEKIAIWAEERQQLTTGQGEFSFGDSSTSQSSGILLPENYNLYSVTFNAVTFTNNSFVEISVTKNANIAYTFAINNGTFIEQVNPELQFMQGDIIGLRTGSKSGNISNVRIAMWLRR